MSEQSAEPLSPHELERRIRQLHAEGLRPRDIAALTGVHPQIVVRIVGIKERTHA